MYEYISNVHPVAGAVSGSGPRSALRFTGLSNIASSNTETATVIFAPPITIDFWFKFDGTYTQTYPPIILSQNVGLGFPAAPLCTLGPVRRATDNALLLEILGVRFIPNDGVIQLNTWIHCQFLLPVSGVPTCRINGGEPLRIESQEYPPAALSTASTTLSGQTYGNGVYTVNRSSSSGESTEAWRVFNKTLNNDAGDWQSATGRYNTTTGEYIGTMSIGGVLGEWVSIQLPVSIIITGISIRSGINLGDRTWNAAPALWTLLGSNDGTTWTAVYALPSIDPFSVDGQTITTSIPMTVAYNRFALVVRRISGTGRSFVNIGEFQLFGFLPILSFPNWTATTHKYIQIRTVGGIEFGNIRLLAGETPVTVENDPVPNSRTIVLLKGHVTPELTIPNRCSIVNDVDFFDMGTTLSKSHVWSGWYNIPRDLQTLTAFQSSGSTFDCRVVIGRPSEPVSLGDMMFAPRFTNTYTNTYSSNVTLPINIIHAPGTKFNAISFDSSNISRSEMRSGCVPYKFRLEQNGRTLKLDTNTGFYDWDNGMRDGIFITSNAIPYNSSRSTAIGVGTGTLTLEQVNRPGSNVTCLCMQDAVTLRTCAFNANGRLVLLPQPGKQTLANTMMHMRFSNIWNPATNQSFNPILFRALY